MLALLPSAFPPFLAAAHDRPAVLYVRGNLPTHGRYVAVVGTRTPSPWALAFTRRVTEYLVTSGWTIVSGLARGIDAEAHEAALRVGGPTVAVLAGGVEVGDEVYPPEHADLAARIVAAGGALVSEQPPGTRGDRQKLVARDRIQSGLSAGVIVAQCGIRSGTLHTARFALLQGRTLFCAQPPLTFAREEASAGNRALLSTGPRCAAALGAEGAWKRALERRDDGARVAFRLASREDYPMVLEWLESSQRNQSRTKESEQW